MLINNSHKYHQNHDHNSNNENESNIHHKYCNNNQNAIYCYSGFGPSFGGSGDLFCYNNGNWRGNPIYYPKIDDIQNNNYFNVDDYEVFQVVKM